MSGERGPSTADYVLYLGSSLIHECDPLSQIFDFSFRRMYFDTYPVILDFFQDVDKAKHKDMVQNKDVDVDKHEDADKETVVDIDTDAVKKGLSLKRCTNWHVSLRLNEEH